MADVLSTSSMLSFPSFSSSAFSTYRTSVVDQSVSASPRRKVARLDIDSDSASASRSRPNPAPTDATRGPLILHVSGSAPKGPELKNLLNPLQGCMELLLNFKTKQNPPLTYERLYAAGRSLVLAGQGEDVAHMLERRLDQCVKDQAEVLLRGDAEGMEYFSLAVERLRWFEAQVAVLVSVLAYLDRAYLAPFHPAQSVRSMAYTRMESRVLNHSTFHERIESAIKAWTAAERKKGAPHEIRKQVSPLIEILQLHGLYQPRFERSYVLETERYYSEAVKDLTGPKGEALPFLAYCLDKIDKEALRAKEVLPEESREAVRKATERGLLTGNLAWLAKGAMPPAFEAKDVDTLQHLYVLYSRRENLPLLADEFKNVVQARVTALISDPAKDDKMVEGLLALKALSDDVVSAALVDRSRGQGGQDRRFAYALRDAFTGGFKARRVKPAEMIAKHVDWVMRKGKLAEQLDAALELYRFTEDRDVFRTFYHRALAKRLLLEWRKTSSDDVEKAVLKKLKDRACLAACFLVVLAAGWRLGADGTGTGTEYDPEFGMGEHMFKDLDLSKDLREGFEKEVLDATKVGEHDVARRMKAVVLQPSFWPFPARENTTTLPSDMRNALDMFTAFYVKKHKGHKLNWHPSLGWAVLEARFDADGTVPKQLSVSLFQAAVLLLFNAKPQISFREIKASTEMEDEELRRTLQSLALGKKRVLRRTEGKGREIADADVFEFNAAFKDPKVEIHINSIQSKETVRLPFGFSFLFDARA
ncbi:Cullin, partial [Amylostereum chailletii]